jgi:TAG lipase/lysophosphatidylethanolamine acyltransferase
MLKKLWAWWTQKSKRDLLLEALADARLFEEWEATAYGLDETLDYDLWYAVLSCSSRPCTDAHL